MLNYYVLAVSKGVILASKPSWPTMLQLEPALIQCKPANHTSQCQECYSFSCILDCCSKTGEQLPLSIKSSCSYDVFKHRLKSHLFEQVLSSFYLAIFELWVVMDIAVSLLCWVNLAA